MLLHYAWPGNKNLERKWSPHLVETDSIKDNENCLISWCVLFPTLENLRQLHLWSHAFDGYQRFFAETKQFDKTLVDDSLPVQCRFQPLIRYAWFKAGYTAEREIVTFKLLQRSALKSHQVTSVWAVLSETGFKNKSSLDVHIVRTTYSSLTFSFLWIHLCITNACNSPSLNKTLFPPRRVYFVYQCHQKCSLDLW